MGSLITRMIIIGLVSGKIFVVCQNYAKIFINFFLKFFKFFLDIPFLSINVSIKIIFFMEGGGEFWPM